MWILSSSYIAILPNGYFGQTRPHCMCYLRLPRNKSVASVRRSCPSHSLSGHSVSVPSKLIQFVSRVSKWTSISSLEGSFHQKIWTTTRRLHCRSVLPHFGIWTSHGTQTIQILQGIGYLEYLLHASDLSLHVQWSNPGWTRCYYIHIFFTKVLPSNSLNLHSHCNPFAQPPLPDLCLKQLQVLS